METKPFYMAAYDTESVNCIKGVRSIVKQHLKYNVTATFFIVGELLEDKLWASEIKGLLDNPLFDVQSHTYTHYPVFPIDNSVPSPAHKQKVLDEIKKTNDIIEKVFNKKVIGFRPPGGYADGLGRSLWLLNGLWYEGIQFISSQLTGPNNTVPAPLANPYWNETDVLRPLLELPGHDWHENILKGHNPGYVMWPPSVPWGYPVQKPKSAKEEFEVFKKGIDCVFNSGEYLYYSPIMHPWSIYRFNKEAETIRLILEYIKSIGMDDRKFVDVYRDIDNDEIEI